MPPVSADTFASALRSLDRNALLAFLAAVWAARGWQTAVTDGRVVAERGDERVTVAPVQPGRLRTPSLPDADVVVSTRADDRVATAAREAGVDHFAPDDLRDLLLYGLDRDVGEQLSRDYLGQPLTVAPAAETDAGTGGSGAEDTSRFPSTRVVLVSLLLLVGGAAAGPALLDGLGSGAGTGDVETLATFEPATGTPTEDGNYPPGVNESGVVSAAELASAHADAVRGRAYVLHVAGDGPASAPFMSGRTAFDQTVRIASDANYRSNSTTHFRRRTANGTEVVTYHLGVYADGETKFRRFVRPNGSVAYRRYPVETTGGADDAYADRASLHVFRYLSTDQSTADCISSVESGGCTEYRVVATGDLALVSRNVSNYRAVATVEASGLVTSLRVRYTVQVEAGGNVTAAFVRFHFDYREFDSVDVDPPGWLDAAKNATGRRNGTTTTATATPSETE